MIVVKRILVLVAAALLVTGCGNKDNGNVESEASLLMKDASDQKDYQRLSSLADSLLRTGDLRPGESYFWQGYAYYQMKQRQVSLYYWNESMKATANSTDPNDLTYYAKSASYLFGQYIRNCEFSIAMQKGMSAVNHLEQLHCDTTSDYTNLLIFTACCRAHFDHNDPISKDLFERAYKMHLDNIRQKATKKAYHDAIAGLANISYGGAIEGNYESGALWAERLEQLVADYRDHFPDDKQYFDKQWSRCKIFHAITLEGLGRHEEAASEYDEYMQTDFAQTPEGLTNATEYLTLAQRWEEAVDCYRMFSNYLSLDSLLYTLDQVQHFMLKKYNAYMMINSIDSANALARTICMSLDSIIMRTREIDALGLETIRQKEAEIVEQERQSAQWQRLTAFLVLGISFLFFIVYTIYRHRVQRRLSKAHNDLKVAYDQLEETTTQKERMESELRIARDIQMSMVPNEFPEFEGINMYASMTPAKEVGGDLYGYVLQDDKLYFAVGDVSGKGVPASLFMAQVTRLFRTLATQSMMPAEICTRMNEALSGEDNVNGMFVTFFLGLVNLKTGHLDFCNAGHNPPVIGRSKDHVDFLQMEPNAPIGLWPGLEYVGEEVEDIKGEMLFIYTDGLNEAENQQLEQFGEERLLNILCTIEYETARQIVDTLKAEVEKHRNGAEPNDDLTMMCLKI